MIPLKHFNPSTDKAINWDVVDWDAIKILDDARDRTSIPFFITSHYRTPEHSVEVGGITTDAHTETPCSAFDIEASNSADRFKIVKACLAVGFPRIGINIKNNHIHVDNSKKLPPFVLWIE